MLSIELGTRYTKEERGGGSREGNRVGGGEKKEEEEEENDNCSQGMHNPVDAENMVNIKANIC